MNGLRRVRDRAPLSLRCALQEHSPGRARCWHTVPGIERLKPTGRAVLTFDDGPGPAAAETSAVLEALDTANARATFFLVGEQVAEAPELTREIVDRGHEIGVHGQRHFRHDRASSRESMSDIEEGYAVVSEAINRQPRFYRPPYGRLTQAGAEACQRLGLEIAYWSTWGLDWEPVSHRRIARRVLRDFDDGAIVLLHDAARYARRPGALETARAIEAIGGRAAEESIALVTLGDACDEARRDTPRAAERA